MTTVNTIQMLGEQEDGELQDTAISVLGASIDKLAANNDEDTSNSLTEALVASLGNANSEDDLELYLGVLGNAGQETTLNEIAQYITGTTKGVPLQHSWKKNNGQKVRLHYSKNYSQLWRIIHFQAMNHFLVILRLMNI